MLSIKFLQAYNGDCIFISFKNGSGSIRNILIDGGTGSTYSSRRKDGDLKKEIELLQRKNLKIDLLVITHIDDDHIGGVLKMFEDKKFNPSIIKKVWFNSGKLIAEHFNDEGEFIERAVPVNIYDHKKTSVRQGVVLDDVLRELDCWDYRIIKRGLVEKIDDCKITVLSPDRRRLKDLHKKWWTERPDSLETSSGKTDYHLSLKDLMKGKDVFKEDSKEPNGSSIAFLLEINEKKLLFLGDAFPTVIVESLKNLGYSKNNQLKLDLFKISHHASSKNTSFELLELVDCERFVTLTNSLKHGLPDKITFARIINSKRNSKLLFNYNIVEKIFSESELKSGDFDASYIDGAAITFDS